MIYMTAVLCLFGLRPPPADPTYGRYTLPYAPREQRIRNDPKLTVWDDRVFLDSKGEATDEKTNSWLYFQVWWDEKAAKEKGALEAIVVV